MDLEEEEEMLLVMITSFFYRRWNLDNDGPFSCSIASVYIFWNFTT